MLSIWKKQELSFSVVGAASLICLSWIQGTTYGQFRDLDSPQQDVTELIDLIPTDEEFLAPIVDAEEQEKVSEPAPKPKKALDQPQQTAKPTVSEASVPVPVPEAKPKAEAKSGSPAASPAKTRQLEPVPMPELSETKLQPTPQHAADTPVKELASPLSALKEGVSPSIASAGIHAASFKGVQPGVTTKAELIAAWGEAVQTATHGDDSATLVYLVPSFKQVEVTVAKDVVSGVLVHFSEPIKVSTAAQQLGIGKFDPVPVPDEFGEVLGQAYPERSILFSFAETDNEAEAVRVSAILLEPISAEMFRMRAQYDFEHNYTRSLSDLEEAIRIDPLDAEAHWMLAEYLDTVGRTRDGLKSVQKAIRLRPVNPIYRITRGRIYAKTNRLEDAIEEVEALIDEMEMDHEVAGMAHNLLGDLLAMGPKADHQKALKHHLQAIDLASKAVDDRRFAVRRMAKLVLVTCHMSVARDIAMGNFQRQREVVPKWLLRATELADEFISDDRGDELLQMLIFRDTLASFSELQKGTFESAVATEEAIRIGRDMIANASDESYKTQIERLLAETLLHAAKIHRSRGKYDSALQFANNAVALLESSDSKWDRVTHDTYLEGQLYFVIGSIYAIRDQNHGEAIEWYAKARSQFVGSNFVTPLYSGRGHGEMYVSMGLSFWEDGDQETAIKLTQNGAALMKDAVEDGSLKLDAMAVPYGNLVTMHAKLGQKKKSQEYAKLVAKLDEVIKTQR